jgi:hypothetical protein
VTGEFQEPGDAPALRALGQVEPPAPGVVEAARERLWSAVAEEMLAAGPQEHPRRTRAAGADRSRDGIRRRPAEPGS